jgi:asparagine synthase (glutamine-hydrolysing)
MKIEASKSAIHLFLQQPYPANIRWTAAASKPNVGNQRIGIAMSGIVGIINLDGAPVDRELLGRMTDFMSFRGPDEQEIWIDGNVGFGHTMLRTTWEAETEKQPLTLDGKVWLTADARIDGRKELIAELEGKLGRRMRVPVASNGNGFLPNGDGSSSNGHGSLSNDRGSDTRVPNDAELILYAYEAWGEEGVKHLIGDFAFAIWDSRARRLFCARDHFGVMPFYYAEVAGCFVFSNTLNCVRLHTVVSSKLNNRAVRNFLVDDYNHDLSISFFEDIRRLPPAHFLIRSQEDTRLNRYWVLPTDGHIQYRNESEYVERFKDLLSIAVEDRLRTNRIGVFMSGGLDSTAVAATASELLRQNYRLFELCAYTADYYRLVPSKERYFAGKVAEHLEIPIEYLAVDDYKLYQGWDRGELLTPEPLNNPLWAIVVDMWSRAAQNSRVVLSGHGSDASFVFSSHIHFSHLLKGFHFGRLFTDAARYFWGKREFPHLTSTFAWLKSLSGNNGIPPVIPRWLIQDAATSADNRPADGQRTNGQSNRTHARRPWAYELLTHPYWTQIFETENAGSTRVALEVRYPFLDLRLIDYLLSIPLIPWTLDKKLIRSSMRANLPEDVRVRPKSPVPGHPLLERLRHPDAQWVDHFEALPELRKYVDRDAIPRVTGEATSYAAHANLRPLNFNFWLTSLRR